MPDPRLYQIALTMIKGVGDILCRHLLDFYKDPADIFREKERALMKIPGIGEQIAREIAHPDVLKRAARELEFVQKNHLQTFFLADNEYPFRLRECPDAPVLLYSKGNMPLNSQRVISIVGTRQASFYGKDMTDKLIRDLSGMFPDLLIVSGLAYGIDIESHRSALKYQLPTVAVLAHGLDRIYPYLHRDTAVRMLDYGGILTDYPSGTNPDRQNFLMRNRIVAGLSDATIVIESAEKGGSLVTADIAFSYGRDVYAFPGRAGDQLSSGCNRMIRQNKAGLITSAEDLVTALCWDVTERHSRKQQQEIQFPTDPLHEKISNLVKDNPEIHINELARLSGMPIHELSSRLFELELEGVIRTLPGSRYRVSD